MATKYYAVKIGRIPGIYNDKDTYLAQVQGFTGYKAKSFKNLEIAELWLRGTIYKPTNSKKEKYYVVRQGRVPGIYTDIKEYQKQVSGFSMSVSKVFKDYNEAYQWYQKGLKKKDKQQQSALTESKKREILIHEAMHAQSVASAAVAYVDGSYNESTKQYSYGIVMIHNDERHLLSGSRCDELSKLCNTAGELESALEAMRWAQRNNVAALTIVHDCEAISTLATGKGRVKQGTTAAYKNFYEQVSENMDITFCHTRGHGGDLLNELADALARLELGMKVKKTLADYIASAKC